MGWDVGSRVFVCNSVALERERERGSKKMGGEKACGERKEWMIHLKNRSELVEREREREREKWGYGLMLWSRDTLCL